MPHPRHLRADNPGPFTLDGTRTYLVGAGRVAVVDPGPDDRAHVEALAEMVGGAAEVTILLTHGHADHAGAASALAGATGAEIAGPEGVEGVRRVLADGGVVQTDAGDLRAVHTPGHTPEHLCYHWPERAALFAGDLLLGKGDTTWVAEYRGCVADYLASLARLRSLDLRTVYPAHGPPLDDPAEALDRFEAHRRERIRQVEEALSARPDASPEELVDLVYGEALPPGLRGPATKSLGALLEHVRG